MTSRNVILKLTWLLFAAASTPASGLPSSRNDSPADTETNAKCTFFIHTTEEPEGIEFNPIDISQYIKLQTETKVITHGFQSNYTQVLNIVKEYLKQQNRRLNLVTFDWRSAAEASEIEASQEALCLGKYFIGDFIDILTQYYKITPDKVHLIGYNIGAHLMGAAGRYQVKKRQGGKLCGRITGLDPASKYFEPANGSLTPLSKSDATFVDVLHTNAGGLGIKATLGTSDFFPNGGQNQSACRTMLYKNCDSLISTDYFAESIRIQDSFQARQCPTWNDFKTYKCENKSVVVIGEVGYLDSNGTYFYWTHDEVPFGAKKNGTSPYEGFTPKS